MSLVTSVLEEAREHGNTAWRFSFGEVPKVIRHHALNVGQLEFLEVGSEITLLVSRVFPDVSIKTEETAAVVIAEVVDARKTGSMLPLSALRMGLGVSDLRTGRELL